jgi:hypothetical protein
MPINTNLNTAPYFDDFNLENQYYRVMFKPSYAVQARELTQLQTMLQNQIEQFGDNIFKEGSIIKGCNFTELNDLQYVKLQNPADFDPFSYVPFTDTETISGQVYERNNVFKIVGQITNVEAEIVAATRGFETRAPDLNTFYINYTNTAAGTKVFQGGETLNIIKVSSVDIGATTNVVETGVGSVPVTNFPDPTGNAFGLQSAPGIIFQKGHFLFAEEQLIVVSKYTNQPDGVSIGYVVQERLISALQDPSLYDNANGSANENAPGADRLKLIPVLTALPTTQADADTTFFTLTRYSNGSAVTLRDVSQYNVIGEEMARRTYEESGDYVVRDFKTKAIRRNGSLKASVGTGLAYVKGYRVETLAEQLLDIDPIANTSVDDRTNQAISFNYGGYVNVLDVGTSGVVPLDGSTVTLKNSSDTAIGTARVRNITKDKIFLFDVRANTGFSDIRTIEGSSGFITVANSSISSTTINGAGNASMIFDTGAVSLKSTSDISLPVREKRNLTGLSSNTVTLSSGTGVDFNTDNDDILIVDATNTTFNVLSTSITNGGNTMIVELDGTPSSNATIYVNKRITDADPFTKSSVELYVKCTFANTDVQTSSKFNLGFPDVYEIVSITDAANTDVTTSFRLKPNQKDHYYDHSYIEFIPGRPAAADGAMTVRMNAFKLEDTNGEYFFTVDSYQNVASNKVQPYRSPSGTTYILRDCLDFRPFVEPVAGATYANAGSLGTAPTVSSSSTSVSIAPSFDPTHAILTPAFNTFAQLDYEFYLNRTDVVTIDSYGALKLVKGTESENSVAQTVTGDQIKIAEIFVPGVPALTQEEAYAQDRPQYGIKVKPSGTKSYRMKDIENVEKKVDALKYYVLLSALEAETKNLNIVDENGLTRFKNGIIVDPFNDLNIANLESTEFNAAVDFSEKSLMPSVKTFPINLKYKSNSSATIFPSTSDARVATLSRNADVSIIDQPYATSFRNCVSNFYSYKGNGSINPEFDALPDVTTNPVTLDIDLVTPFSQFIDAMQEVMPITSVSPELINSVLVDPGRRGFFGFGRRAATFEDTFLDTTTTLQVTEEDTIDNHVGDFVSNINFNPFMNAREIKIYMSGLRPSTQHYFFFDEVDVNEFVAPGDSVDSAAEVHRNGNFGTAVTTDANGVLTAIFALPAERFFVGDRKLEIVDVDAYGTIESASTSYGSVIYRAYNFSIEKSSLTVSTRTPTNFIDVTTSERNVPRRAAPQRNFFDPIAQTFFVKQGMGRGSNTVFVSKIDLYFKRKSETNGAIVELREVINGYPSYQNVPFSRVHLKPAEISVSDDASQSTTVVFTAPVRLDVEKEYAFVIMPDASDPNYLIFTSQVGGTNLTPGANQGLAIVQDWGDGVLFTSTNNRAWKSYQDEDIKFTLYRHNFNSSSGSVTLTNNDHEFLTTENNIGRFKTGELVYKIYDSDALTANTVSVVTGNNQISGTFLTETYAADDFILVDNGTNKQIFQVVSANSTVIVADRPASFTATLPGNPVTVGTLRHYDFRYPTFIILEESNATSTRKFEAADTIYGFDSDTEATVTSVDNISFSYIQPMIMRTNDSVTSTTLSGTFVDPNNTTSTYVQPMPFNDNTYFGKTGMVVFSKSNDIARTKTMDFTVSMQNSSNVTSTPFIDIETATVLAYQWKITNTSATTSKYVSKTVELAESLDAEDFEIFVTAYRPNGTNVKVYIRPQAADDPSVFDNADWIELELTEGINLYSSIANRFDFRDFVYKLPESAKTNGVLTYTNEIGTFIGYRRFAIKIELLSENIFKAPRLLDYRGISLT